MEANPTSLSPVMDPSESPAAVVDPSALRGLFAHGGIALVRQMVEMCIDTCSQRVASIRAAQASADLAAVAKAAHAMKSSAGIIGGRRLQQRADHLYRKATEGDEPAVAELVADLQDVFLQTRAAVAELPRELAK